MKLKDPYNNVYTYLIILIKQESYARLYNKIMPKILHLNEL